MWGNLNTFAQLVGMKKDASAMENDIVVPQKFKNRITIDVAILLLGMCPEEQKARC